MQQPSHDLKAFQTSAASPRRFMSIGAVILLHVILIYALASGLASNMAQKVIQDVQVAVVQEKPPQQKLPHQCDWLHPPSQPQPLQPQPWSLQSPPWSLSQKL